MPTLNYYLNGIGRCTTLYRGHRLEGTELVPGDVPYLFHICHHRGEPQEAIAKALYVHKSKVTRRVTRLEEQGYLTRTPDPQDRRALLVYPTEKALDVLPRLREINAAWHAALTTGFTPEESEQLMALLSRALRNARATVDGEGDAE
jgi:DNA-binding MarR family transcriptional regulator